MQMVCFPGLLRILAGFPLDLIWPAGLCRPAGRVCSWGGLTVTTILLTTAINFQHNGAHMRHSIFTLYVKVNRVKRWVFKVIL